MEIDSPDLEKNTTYGLYVYVNKMISELKHNK